MRIIVATTIAGFIIAGIAIALGSASEAPLAGFVGLVSVGVVAGVGAATIAGSDYPRRRTTAVVLAGATTAAVSLGVWLGSLVGYDPAEHDLGHMAMVSLIAAFIPVVLGILLGYMVGRERQISRRS